MSAETAKVCPECGGTCDRDSVDVGVGVIYGPWGCCDCGWGENGGARVEGDRYIDQFGGSTSIERMADNAERLGIDRQVVLDAFSEDAP